MERSQKPGTHVPVIALDDGTAIRDESWVDAVMPEPIDPDALTATVGQLARALAQQTRDSAASNGGKSLDVLNPEKFKEQVGFDSELMVEIIDLFLDERQRQEPEMRNALEAGKFDLVSRLAHTIKGSLGSLHAMRARSHAQELEIAAKQRDEDICWETLAALEADLAQLEPELLALRQGV
jgi:HPt (histidine-containing phosphotransfer) domain-containing protein